MLQYDKLQRGFTNKQTTRNLRFSWGVAVEKAQKKFPPKLNWETLANCVDTVIFARSFSNAGNSFAEKGFTHILLPRFVTLLAGTGCITLKVKLYFIHHFLFHLLTRIILLAGHPV